MARVQLIPEPVDASMTEFTPATPGHQVACKMDNFTDTTDRFGA